VEAFSLLGQALSIALSLLTGTIGHFLTVLSYNGGVKFGLASDSVQNCTACSCCEILRLLIPIFALSAAALGAGPGAAGHSLRGPSEAAGSAGWGVKSGRRTSSLAGVERNLFLEATFSRSIIAIINRRAYVAFASSRRTTAPDDCCTMTRSAAAAAEAAPAPEPAPLESSNEVARVVEGGISSRRSNSKVSVPTRTRDHSAEMKSARGMIRHETEWVCSCNKRTWHRIGELRRFEGDEIDRIDVLHIVCSGTERS
jgi:hypothetical protein